MNRHDSGWLRALIYIPGGALLWGAVAGLHGLTDDRVTAMTVVFGALLGLLFSVMPSGWR